VWLDLFEDQFLAYRYTVRVRETGNDEPFSLRKVGYYVIDINGGFTVAYWIRIINLCKRGRFTLAIDNGLADFMGKF
jgi:hypothetical protein